MDARPDLPHVVSLPADPSSAALARQAVRSSLRGRGVDAEAIHGVTLAASELVTNAIVHTTSPVVLLAIDLRTEAVRLEVADDSPEAPELRQPDPRSTGGRGLFLVEALARQWGVTRTPGGGKGVWAEIACPVTRRPGRGASPAGRRRGRDVLFPFPLGGSPATVRGDAG